MKISNLLVHSQSHSPGYTRLSCLFNVQRFFLFVVCFVACLPSAFAAEGFSSDPNGLPSAGLRRVWNSAFLVTANDGGRLSYGTAFPIHVEVKTDKREKWIYFLTAQHVISGRCVNPGDFCRGVSFNNGVKVNLSNDTKQDVIANPTRFSNLILVRSNPVADISLIAAVVPESTDVSQVQTLPIRTNCGVQERERLYTIGFPAVYRRKLWQTTSAAQDSDWLVKRWSQGLAIGIFIVPTGPSSGELFFATTVDGLPGNSGGPVVDSNGQIVGIVSRVDLAPGGELSYEGIETSNKLEQHLYAVSCEMIMKFMTNR